MIFKKKKNAPEQKEESIESKETRKNSEPLENTDSVTFAEQTESAEDIEKIQGDEANESAEANESTEALTESADSKENNTKKKKKKSEPAEKKKVPLFSKILLVIAGISLIFYIIFLNSPTVADFFNKYVSSVIRAILSYLTTWIPFSLAEMLLILVPVIVVLVVGIGIKKYSSSWRNVGVFCVIMLSIASYVFTTFTFGFVPAYHGSTLDKKMNLDKQLVTTQQLYDTGKILSTALNEESEYIIFNGEGSSVMPYGYNELNDKLMTAYEKACEKYDFISPLHSNIKEIMLSKPMTYTHISGVYTFFTGEANINVNFPDYVLPYTAAHEFAHQRGIAREDEANFVAFLVCMESDDHYIRYSAYLNLYEYVSNALYSESPKKAAKLYQSLPKGVQGEMSAYHEFFDEYEENVVSNVSGAINNGYQIINGVKEGSKSYGMVVDLAVAYYKSAK